MRVGPGARRWGTLVAALLGTVLTVLSVMVVLNRPPTTYHATSQALLLLPTDSRSQRVEVNPFLYQPSGLILLARVPLFPVRSDDFRQAMIAAGHDSRFELDVEVRAPVVRFSVEGADPDDVNETMRELRRRYDDIIRQAQIDEGVPARQFASVTEIQSIGAMPITGDRRRAAIVVAVMGLVLTLAAATGLRRFVASSDRGRREPRSRGSGPGEVPRGSSSGGTTALEAVRLPAVAFLVVYAGLLLLIPSRLGIPAIGGPGKPSSLWALLCLGLWGFMTLAGWNSGRSRPIRFATGAVAVAMLASYVAGHIVGWYQPADIHQRSDSNWRLVTPPDLRDVMISAGDRGLLAMAGWLGIVLVAAEGLRSWKDLERLVTWIVRFAGVVATLGLLQYFTGINVAAYIQIPGLSTAVDFTTYTRSVLNRVVATSGHPIEFGVVMATVLPLALHRSLHNRNLGSWIPTGLIGLMVLMSVSRSAVLAMGAALLVLFLGWPTRWRLLALVAAPFIAVAGRAAFPGLLGTIRGLFTNIEGDPSVEGRTADYPVVMDVFAQNPLFGKGVYTWGTYYYRTLDNQVLVFLLEVGVIGLLALSALFATGFLSGVLSRRFTHDDRQRHLGLALSAGIAGICLSYLTFDTLGFAQAAGLTFLFVGMAGAALRLSREQNASAASTETEVPVATDEVGTRERPGQGSGDRPLAEISS
jgi:hypothetical protein